MGLWSTKSIATLQTDPTTSGTIPIFERTLGVVNLTALGVGAIIGAGIFIRTGTAAAQYAGPAVVLSFVLAGIGCLFVALCYAEFASMIPVAGSAYTYSYAALGELPAWIVGWNLILEYLFGAATVAVSWSGYFVGLLRDLGVNLPLSLTQAPLTEWGWHVRQVPGAIANVPAMVLVLFLTAVLVTGIRQSANLNSAIVVVKVAIILLVIGFGFLYIRIDNWHPFVPPNEGSFGRYGWSGVLRGASVVFIAFLGFDAVSTASQESKNPHRDVPIAIIGSLAICTVLYVLMALVVTGLVKYPDLNAPHPVFVAVSAAGPALHWLTYLINVAAMAGLLTVALVMLIAQSRVFFAMSSDGLLSPALSRSRRRNAAVGPTVLTGVVAAAVAGFLPIGLLGELTVVATLLVFIIVCLGIMVLRYRRPNLGRPFRTPWVPFVPLLGIMFSAGIMLILPSDTWIRLGIWTAAGLVIYFLYSARHSRLSR
jgi:APA family basic amino acid/polyamine antiporter